MAAAAVVALMIAGGTMAWRGGLLSSFFSSLGGGANVTIDGRQVAGPRFPLEKGLSHRLVGEIRLNRSILPETEPERSDRLRRWSESARVVLATERVGLSEQSIPLSIDNTGRILSFQGMLRTPNTPDHCELTIHVTDYRRKVRGGHRTMIVFRHPLALQ